MLFRSYCSDFKNGILVDESNVVFYCSSVRASKDGRKKAFPYTDRSDPFMFAKPDEGQQGVTVIIPITGPVPLVTHQGSPQMVRSLVTLTDVNVY